MSLRVYAHRLVVAAGGQLVCEHLRIINRRHDTAGQTFYDWRHYLAVLQRKPGALRNGAPFAELPEGFRRLQGSLLKQPGGDREMAEILAIQLDEQAAVDWSLASAPCTPGRKYRQFEANSLPKIAAMSWRSPSSRITSKYSPSSK